MLDMCAKRGYSDCDLQTIHLLSGRVLQFLEDNEVTRLYERYWESVDRDDEKCLVDALQIVKQMLDLCVCVSAWNLHPAALVYAHHVTFLRRQPSLQFAALRYVTYIILTLKYRFMVSSSPWQELYTQLCESASSVIACLNEDEDGELLQDCEGVEMLASTTLAAFARPWSLPETAALLPPTETVVGTIALHQRCVS